MKNLLIALNSSADVSLSFTDNAGNSITPVGVNGYVQSIPQGGGEPDIHLATVAISSDGLTATVTAGDVFTGITTVVISASDPQGNDLQAFIFGIHVVQPDYQNAGFVQGDIV